MILFLIGCLTQERFAEEWAPTLCAAANECGTEIEGIDCDAPRAFHDCIVWDADAGAVCLDAMADACGDIPEECHQFLTCPE